jgi:hypothetical protein
VPTLNMVTTSPSKRRSRMDHCSPGRGVRSRPAKRHQRTLRVEPVALIVALPPIVFLPPLGRADQPGFRSHEGLGDLPLIARNALVHQRMAHPGQRNQQRSGQQHQHHHQRQTALGISKTRVHGLTPPGSVAAPRCAG